MISHRHGSLWLAVAAGAAAISLFAVGLTLVARAHNTQMFNEQAAKNCSDLNTVKAALTAVLRDAEQRGDGRTPYEKEEVMRFYERQIARFRPAKCLPA